MCVQHVTRRKAAEVIEQRILESIKLDKLIKLGDLNGKAELTSKYSCFHSNGILVVYVCVWIYKHTSEYRYF